MIHFVHKLDSLWQPLLESPDFNEEEYEDNYMEYSRETFLGKSYRGLNTKNPDFITPFIPDLLILEIIEQVTAIAVN